MTRFRIAGRLFPYREPSLLPHKVKIGVEGTLQAAGHQALEDENAQPSVEPAALLP